MKNTVYKLLSILLSVSLLLSVGVYATATSTELPANSYYVCSPGYKSYGTTQADGSENKPFETVYDLVKYVNENTQLGAGDTVNAIILQRSDYNTAYGSATINSASAAVHSTTSWSYIDDGKSSTIVPAHTYTLNICSPAGQQNHLAFSPKMGSNMDMKLNGPTIFDNVTLLNIEKGSEWKNVCLEGHDAIFTENCVWAWAKTFNNATWASNMIFPQRAENLQMVRALSGKYEYSNPVNITLNAPVGNGAQSPFQFYIPTYRNNSAYAIYNNDVNINIDNAASKIAFYWGCGYAAAAASEFNETLNINIKDAAAITNIDRAGPVAINNLQVIMPSDISFTDVSTLEGVTVKNAWYINVDAVSNNLISIATDDSGKTIPGKFNVAKGYAAVAKNTVTGEETPSVNGSLGLAAGSYTVSFSTDESIEYYVKSPGYTSYGTTQADGSLEKPFETVYDLIEYVNENKVLSSKDVVTAIVLQRDDYSTAFGTATIDGTSTGVHSVTSLSYKEDEASSILPSHSFTLRICSPAGEKNCLAYSPKMGPNLDVKLGGPVIFDNVKILNTYYNIEAKTLCLQGNSTTFTDNCVFSWAKMYANGTWNSDIYDNRAEYMQMVRAYTGSYTYNNTVDININAPVGNGNKGQFEFYIPSSRVNDVPVTFEKDVNITVNNAAAKVNFTWGNATQVESPKATTFEKNLNFIIKDATAITHTDSLGVVEINGALQVLFPDDIDFADVTAFDGVTATKALFLKVQDIQKNPLILATDESGNTIAGKFEVSGDYTAIVADTDGNVIKTSSNGILDLTDYNGAYEIRFAESYDNDGTKITVYETGEIDLSTVEHDDFEGKIFVGWAFEDGTYPEKVDSYEYGDVLYAQYIEYTTDDFGVEHIEIRDDSTESTVAPALRFVFSENKKLPNVTKRGILTLPITKSAGTELYLNEPVVKQWTWTTDDKSAFTPSQTGDTPYNVEVKNILEETETQIKYSLCLTDITKDDYDSFYAVRGYIQYNDNNGIGYIFYSKQDVSSAYKAAAEADKETLTESEKATFDSIINYVEGERIENYWLANGLTKDGKITSETTTQYLDMGCGCFGKDTCTHKVFRMPTSDKLYIQDITLNLGIDGFEETQIGFMADVHFDYVDQTDIANKDMALSSYRGRTTFRPNQFYYAQRGMMEFGSIFKKTVLGGDVIDYMSNGTLNAMDRLVTKQSVKNRNVRFVVNGTTSADAIGGSLSAVFGNHEPIRLCQSDDKSLKETWTNEQFHEVISKKWPNDTYYSSEILLDSKGNEQVLMVYLDNSFITYNRAQYEHFSVDIAYARNNNLPILIFQHRPMLTMNPEETAHKNITGYNNAYMFAPQDDKYYNIAEVNGKKTYTVKTDVPEVAVCAGIVADVVDMTSFSGYSGYGVDPAAEDVYNLIRLNADIIKGVFCGHIHANTETQIVGMNPDGTSNDLRIPQHTTFLAGWSGVTRIILK